MTGKQIFIAAVGAALLAVPVLAIAADQVGEHSEKAIALSEVPKAAIDGAKTRLTSVTKAELVTMKDGRTLYELKGKTSAGKTVELFVTADGQVLGTEDEMEHER
jgi:hypothetical protein